MGLWLAILLIMFLRMQNEGSLKDQVNQFALEFDCQQAIGVTMAFLPSGGIEYALMCFGDDGAILRHYRGSRSNHNNYRQARVPIEEARPFFHELEEIGLFSLPTVPPRVKDGCPTEVYAIDGERNHGFSMNSGGVKQKKIAKKALEFARKHCSP